MSWPPANSPFWSIIRQLSLFFLIGVMLAWNYNSGFVPEKDVPTMLGYLLMSFGMEKAQNLFKNKKKKEIKDD